MRLMAHGLAVGLRPREHGEPLIGVAVFAWGGGVETPCATPENAD
jgi:hypothetical protein